MLANVDSNSSHSCQVGWMSFGWWTILDTHGKLSTVEKLSFVAVLDILKLVRLAPVEAAEGGQLIMAGTELLEWHQTQGNHV